MIQFITKLITKFGVGAYKAQFIAWGVIVLLAIVLIIGVITGLKSCFKKTPHINEEQIQKINSQNKAEREAELKAIVEQNADTIKIVDNREIESALSIEQRDKLIDAKVKEADQKIIEAKTANGGKDITAEELHCLLSPEDCK